MWAPAEMKERYNSGKVFVTGERSTAFGAFRSAPTSSRGAESLSAAAQPDTCGAGSAGHAMERPVLQRTERLHRLGIGRVERHSASA